MKQHTSPPAALHVFTIPFGGGYCRLACDTKGERLIECFDCSLEDIADYWSVRYRARVILWFDSPHNTFNTAMAAIAALRKVNAS